MIWLYNVGIAVFSLGIKTASLFNKKAKLLRKGRQDVWCAIEKCPIDSSTIWVHVASLGEFEQGRPLIEAIKQRSPERKIVLTFFSPSGYEIRKDYELADFVFYLPADTPRNAQRFLDAIKPEMVFFIKYEFWYHYLTEVQKRSIPLYGVSVILRKEQLFFKWYGAWYRRVLHAFSHLYVQDEVSGDLLNQIGITKFSVSGDTRFDRVKEIADHSPDIPLVREFCGQSKTIVAGSSWPAGEKLLCKYMNSNAKNVKLIIAPHEIHEGHIREIENQLEVSFFRYTNPPKDPFAYQVMIVDTIGLLSVIYKYGVVAYIGGGFGSGIHNTLEAATYGMPVLFGPNYKKYKEACDLVTNGGGFEVSGYDSFEQIMDELLSDDVKLKEAGKYAGDYVNAMCGSTSLIMDDLFKKSAHGKE
jgi:3-deoxy-D-manno-octulosonic-acid transferase